MNSTDGSAGYYNSHPPGSPAGPTATSTTVSSPTRTQTQRFITIRTAATETETQTFFITSTPPPTETQSALSSADESKLIDNNKNGIIIGGSICGIVALTLISVLVVFFVLGRRKKKAASEAKARRSDAHFTVANPAKMWTEMGDEKPEVIVMPRSYR